MYQQRSVANLAADLGVEYGDVAVVLARLAEDELDFAGEQYPARRRGLLDPISGHAGRVMAATDDPTASPTGRLSAQPLLRLVCLRVRDQDAPRFVRPAPDTTAQLM